MKQRSGARIIQCSLNRTKPVKAAVIVFGDTLEVIHDPQLVTETEAAVLLVCGNLKVGVISVYYEGDQDIELSINRTKSLCNSVGTNNIIVAGDVNAWSYWWGSSAEDQRGIAYSAFLDEMGYHILNTGSTPTFEVYRGGKACTSVVDVTACSQSLLGKIENWRVDRDLTTSDHNAITFEMQLEQKLTPLKPVSTRRYNTKKARWKDLSQLFKAALMENNITPQTVEECGDSDCLDSILAKYTEVLHNICGKTIPLVIQRTGISNPRWMSKEIREQKKEVLRRKRRIRNAAPHRRQLVVAEYIEAKTQYIASAENAQIQSWKEFCTTQEKESMWDKVYRVIRVSTRRQEDLLLRDEKGKTLDPHRSAELLAKTFYPDDTEETDNEHHKGIRSEDAREVAHHPDDPPFTPAEVDIVLSAMNPKKAPGPDGLTSDICAAAISSDREVFLAIANKCLSLGYFPRQWKVAHVVILRKPGKEDYTHPKSYRPIGLLSVLGKIVEKVMVGRLQWHVYPSLSRSQYGFMPQRGTEDALYDLVEHIREGVAKKNAVLLISLDIEGAFDNAWWPILKKRLREKNCPRNIYAMVDSYLHDRKIVVNYARAAYEKGTNKGCVQGSIGGPTFWNIILDSLLHGLAEEGVYCQAFADDVVLVIADKDMGRINTKANTTLKVVRKWGEENKLSFAPHKTKAMLFTKKLKLQPLELCMADVKINLVEELKLLGLILDPNLTFKAHVAACCKKAAEIYKHLACAAKVTWGLNGEIVRTIYVAVIEPIMTYASSVWYKSTELQMIRDMLDALQRGFAQKVCKAYRTVSLTSSLALSGILPLDLRIQEAATLFRTKKGKTTAYIPAGCEMEACLRQLDLPHPSRLGTLDYEISESMESRDPTSRQVSGPLIFTDGSKIEGRVGAALTWWEDGVETKFATFSLHPLCTVFQSELYALSKAVELAFFSKDPLINILSDSRSSLDLLKSPKTTHPLGRKIRETVGKIRAEGRDVRLFWVRAHVGTAGNERADELAKKAAATAGVFSYDKIPLSHVKSAIREESVAKWQDRYTTCSTGAVTKAFLPDIRKAYKLTRTTKLSATLVQVLTGHGGIAEYLYRFRLKDSPGCECDEAVNETVFHVITECPRFMAARQELETKIGSTITALSLPDLLGTMEYRTPFISFAEYAFRVAAKRNATLETPPQNTVWEVRSRPDETENPPPQDLAVARFLAGGEQGSPRLRVKSVALFMDCNTERLGISFCHANAKNRVVISPGLGVLLNGSASKVSMRKKAYFAMPQVRLANCPCRLVRSKNKTIALVEWGQTTPFAQTCSLLTKLGEIARDMSHKPRVISVDAMAIEYEKGEVADLLGCVKASEHHEVVVYENRGEDLGFLKAPVHQHAPTPVAALEHRPIEPIVMTGTERLQQKADSSPKTTTVSQTGRTAYAITHHMLQVISGPSKSRTPAKSNDPLQRVSKMGKKTRTKADMGKVGWPTYIPVTKPRDHLVNAFLEFVALNQGTDKMNLEICSTILQKYRELKEGRSTAILLNTLATKLEEAEAAIYDNEKTQIIMGSMHGSHMAAYNQARGFVELLSEEPDQSTPKYATPPEDPIVVTAQCTRVMLGGRILRKAEPFAKLDDLEALWGDWAVPKFTWINGVPGCGKTTWVINAFKVDEDLIATTTTEALEDLRVKLAHRVGDRVKTKVRTLASILVNGVAQRCSRLIVDEALMNHFGAIVLASRLCSAQEVVLLGDVNQLPYIDRHRLFNVLYNRPSMVINIDQELLCTHRNPMDVAFALRVVYPGIYSSSPKVRSLAQMSFTGTSIPKTSPHTLYLSHTQEDKEALKNMGFGTGEGSRVLTIHEAQGLIADTVVVIKIKVSKNELYNSVGHAVVAISRHTKTCTYYADDPEDAIGRFITNATGATDKMIWEHTLKMAIAQRDQAVITSLLPE